MASCHRAHRSRIGGLCVSLAAGPMVYRMAVKRENGATVWRAPAAARPPSPAPYPLFLTNTNVTTTAPEPPDHTVNRKPYCPCKTMLASYAKQTNIRLLVPSSRHWRRAAHTVAAPEPRECQAPRSAATSTTLPARQLLARPFKQRDGCNGRSDRTRPGTRPCDSGGGRPHPRRSPSTR